MKRSRAARRKSSRAPLRRRADPSHSAADDHCAIACRECSWGDDLQGNEILLCDTVGCSGAYHLKCLPNPLSAVPSGDWFCPACSPDEPTKPFKLSVSSSERSLNRELQVINGIDLMAWTREKALMKLPSPACSPSEPWTQASLCGRACLFASSAEASLRAGILVDLRHAKPSQVASVARE